MKKFIYIAIAAIFIVSMSSCGAGASIKKENNDNQVAGYTLKNKKELMKHRILPKKSKTIIAIP